jgi:hypothetical protein
MNLPQELYDDTANTAKENNDSGMMHQTARTDLIKGQHLSPLLRAQSLAHLGSGEKEKSV